MSKHLPVPPDLQHLIEKRHEENDRRKTKAPTRGATPGPAEAPKRRERRQKSDRRRRRKSGS